MKRDYRGLCLCLLLVLAAPAADAADKFHDLSVKGAAESEIGKSKLLDVPFYMSGQKHAGVAKDLGVFTSNKRTNAFGKSDEAACQIAFLSAVISLQSRSNKLGGNAIIDGAPDLAVRHQDLDVVRSRKFGDEQVDSLDSSGLAAGLDIVADLERAEDQQHDSGRDIAQRTLQGEADRQARRAENGDQTGRLDAEL